jgi:hypothetical protein
VRRFGIGGRSTFSCSFSSFKNRTEKTVTLTRLCHLKLQYQFTGSQIIRVWMSSSFRFYCFSSGLDIFIKYGYYDIRAEAVQISIIPLRGVGLCEVIWNWR